MLIRLERPGDHDAVGALHRAAFGDHGTVVAALVGALRRDDPAALSLIAEEDGAVAGHVMVSRAWLDAPRRIVPVQTLSPLAVAPGRQRRGLGGALIREALSRAAGPLVFLEGDPGYYARHGFRAAGELGFRKPSLRIPDPGFQVYPLAGYEEWMTGTFVYPNTFWEHDCVGLRDPDA